MQITANQVRQIRGEDTQSELAHRLGASSNAVVSRWELGRTKPSRKLAAKLAALARVRNVDLGDGEAAGA